MLTREEVLKCVDNINNLFKEKMDNATLTEEGKKHFLKLLKINSYEDIYKALEISIDTYFVLGDDNSKNDVINKLEGIMYNLKFQEEKPEIAEINYLLKIAKNRFNLSGLFYKDIKDLLLDNYTNKDFKELKDIFCNYSGYTPLKHQLELYYEQK